jgi:hypothetical protein
LTVAEWRAEWESPTPRGNRFLFGSSTIAAREQRRGR